MRYDSATKDLERPYNVLGCDVPFSGLAAVKDAMQVSLRELHGCPRMAAMGRCSVCPAAVQADQRGGGGDISPWPARGQAWRAVQTTGGSTRRNRN